MSGEQLGMSNGRRETGRGVSDLVLPEDDAININRVVAGSGGQGWGFADGALTIAGNGRYTIEGTGVPTTNRIAVAAGVNIDVSGIRNACAFDMTGAAVELILVPGSTNVLKSNGAAAGLQAPGGGDALGSRLTITSGAGAGSDAGTLTVYGGAQAAGIGGGWEQAGGRITINGGTITATGSFGAGASGGGAGIGGGFRGDGGGITINGGAVRAYCAGKDWTAAAIGGGGQRYQYRHP